MVKLPYSNLPLGQHAAAEKRSRVPVRTQSRGSGNSPEIFARLQEGIALQLKGNVGLAGEIYQGILTQYPNNADALHLMGTLAVATGQINGALDLLNRAVVRKPEDPSIRINLAHALLEKDEPETAEFHLRKALKAMPDRPEVLCPLASCRMALGDTSSARKIYDDLLARLPEHSQVLIGYADFCQSMGEIEPAQATYRKALKVAPVLALTGLASCQKLAKTSPEATEIMQHLGRPGLPRDQLMNLNYAAAGIFETAGDYDEAFAHFAQAKTLGAGSFSIENHQQTLSVLKKLFTREFFEARTRYGHSSKRPVFVVGMPRSGTTLTEQIISRHAQAAAGGERRDIPQMTMSLGFRDGAKDYSKRLAKLTQAEAKVLANRYLGALERVSADRDRVVDKMPQNFIHLGLIALLFPKARIVHCRRNPLDNCLSCFTMHLRDHHHGYTADLGTLGLYYREYVSLMAHWREVLPMPIYDVDYEAMVEDPERETRRLIDFVGLPWDPACLAPQDSRLPVRTLSRMQVRQPIYRTSVQRWRRYEKHLGPLKEALGYLVAEPANTSNPLP